MNPPKRPSKAASVFCPIKPQSELDAEELAQQRAQIYRAFVKQVHYSIIFTAALVAAFFLLT